MPNGYQRTNRLRPYPAPAGSIAARPVAPRRPQAGVPSGSGGVDDILATLRKSEPRNMADLADAMRADYQVKFADWILRASIMSVPVTIATDSPDPRAVAFADAMQDLWYATLNSMCDAIGDGRVAYSKCWRFDRATFLHVPELTPLPFRATTLSLTDDGDFNGIKLKGRSTNLMEKAVDIPVEQSWWLAIDATPIEPHGRSRYLGATQAEWMSRREVFELRMTFLRKFCLNGGVIRGPGTVIDPTTNKPVPAAPLLQESYKNRQQGGVMYLPGERDRVSGEFPFDVTETSRLDDPGPIDVTLDKSDVRVLRSLGISELAVQQTGDLGSYAMAAIHMRVLNTVVAGLVAQFAESFESYVIDAAAAYNFLPGETPDVTLTYPDLTAVPDSLMVEIAKAVLTSPTLPAGAALVNLKTIFEASGIPITDDFEARLAAALDQAKAAAQPQPFGLPYQQPQPAPQPRGVGMANEAAPAIPNLPNAATILADTTAEISAIFGQLFALAGQRVAASVQEQERLDREIRSVLDELQRIVGESRFAMRVLGMLSPWFPVVQDNPRAVRQSGIGMANEAPGAPNRIWPFLDHAIDFLASREVVTPEQFRTLSRDEQATAFTMPGDNSAGIVAEMLQEITVSFGSGESLDNFKTRLRGNLQASESAVNTIFRTTTHQAYVEGQDRALQSPAVAAEFPYVMFISTRDTRTRPAHRAVDGFVVKVGSREHELLKRLIRDWNCRCQLIPLTQADALSRGVKTYSDIPQVTLADLAA